MDTLNIVQLSAQGILLVPICMAIVSVVKLYIDSRWSPLVALVSGVALSFIDPQATAGWTVLSGIIIGLTASGMYSGVKATMSSGPVQLLATPTN